MTSRADRRVAGWLAAVATLVYLPFNHCHFSSTDEASVLDTAVSLYARGELAVEPGIHRSSGPDGRFYSHYAVGQSVLVLPFLAAADLLEWLVPEELLDRAIGREDQGYLDTRESPYVFLAGLYAPLVGGLLLGVFYLFERRLGARVGGALRASVLLGASTYVATMSVFFLRHGTEALAILASFGSLYAWRRTGRAGWLAAGSACASALLLIRIPAAVAAPALGAYLLFTLGERWRREASTRSRLAMLAAAALPALACALIHLGLNQARWGTWLESPMFGVVDAPEGSLSEGLRGLLISPGAGLLLHAPPLLLLGYCARAFWRSRRAEAVTLLALGVSFLLLYGSVFFWHGLWTAPGPRYLVALIPPLMLPLGPWLDTTLRVHQRAAIGLVAAVGGLVQLPLLSASWRETLLRLGWSEAAARAGQEPALVALDFLFDPTRAPVVEAARVVLAGGVDAYLWSLWWGVPGREAQPALAVALLVAWGGAALVCAQRLRVAAHRSRAAEAPGPPLVATEPLRGAGRIAVWTASLALSAFVALSWWGAQRFGAAMRDEDAARATAALDLLSRVGADSAVNRARVAELWARSGQPGRAIAQLERSVALRPAADRHAMLGRFAFRHGYEATALRHYRAALRDAPDHHAAANGAAWILATSADPQLRDAAEAIRLARRALAALEIPDPNYLDTLAAGYAAADRLEKAIATLELALELARARGATTLVGSLEASLAAYRARLASRVD